ncbi:MAG: ribosome maturation factor RimM [Armatimonadota bacterium]|nr:ribosome maturation factor RimM [Armatimonadota bacterium]
MPKPYIPKVARRWVTVGVVSRPFGMRGELRVRVETDFPERFQPGARVFWWIPPKPTPEPSDESAPARSPKKPPRTMQPQPCTIKSVRWQGDQLILQLEGIDTRAQAEQLRGAWLLVPPEERMPLEEDEYYIDDLLGMEVFTETGERVGKLKQIRRGIAYDYFEVGEHLIPAVAEYILKVDLANKRMVVRLPKIE